MNRSKRVAVLSVGIFLAWVGLGFFSELIVSAGGRPNEARRDPTTVKVDRIIRERGSLEAGEWIEIRNETGRTLPVVAVVPSGKAVKKGDLLVELDADPLAEERIQQVLRVRKAEAGFIDANVCRSGAEKAASSAIEMAEKALRVAEAQHKTYTEGEYPHQLMIAEAQVKLATNRAMEMQARVERLQAKLQENQEEMRDRLHDAKLALFEAELQAATAKGNLALLKGFLHTQRMAELDLAVAQRVSELTRAKEALAEARSKAGNTLSLAEVNYHMEKDRLAKLDDLLAKTKMYAPGDGTASWGDGPFADETGTRLPGLQRGAVVRNGQVMIRFGDSRWWIIEVVTTSPMAQQILPGQPATIHLDTIPARMVAGHVSRVRVDSRPMKPSVITVQVDKPSDDLEVGMSATVELDLSKRSQDTGSSR